MNPDSSWTPPSYYWGHDDTGTIVQMPSGNYTYTEHVVGGDDRGASMAARSIEATDDIMEELADNSLDPGNDPEVLLLALVRDVLQMGVNGAQLPDILIELAEGLDLIYARK